MESSYYRRHQRDSLGQPGLRPDRQPSVQGANRTADAIHAEDVRNHNVPRFPTGGAGFATGEGLPVLVDNESDFTIWQTKLPNWQPAAWGLRRCGQVRRLQPGGCPRRFGPGQ